MDLAYKLGADKISYRKWTYERLISQFEEIVLKLLFGYSLIGVGNETMGRIQHRL